MLQSLVGVYCLVEGVHRFVCVEIGGVRIEGVYGQCSERIHDMER